MGLVLENIPYECYNNNFDIFSKKKLGEPNAKPFYSAVHSASPISVK